MKRRTCGAAGLLWVVALASAVVPAALLAQTPTPRAVLHGFVREAESGEPVAMAHIVVEGAAEVSSDRSGYFAAARLSAGEYRLSVRALGYTPLDTLLATSTTPVELRLVRAPLEIAPACARPARWSVTAHSPKSRYAR
jgi:hypothetical protein